MQIIDIGICVNNNDPKGAGRIRYRPYGLYLSEITNGIEYKEWDDNDPLIASPFLPAHINIIPRIKTSVKLIKYDTDKEVQNVEYVTGPFSSPHDFGEETFTSQHKYTTYGGVIVKEKKDIRNKDGKLLPPLTDGSIPKLTDIAFKGNYGSDIIFTDNGLQIRGGFLIDKSNDKKNKQSALDYPKQSKKYNRFSMKKFPKTMVLSEENTIEQTIDKKSINYIIEYDVDDLNTPKFLNFYVYKVINNNNENLDVSVFNTNTGYDKESVKLINLDNTITTPTITRNLDGTIKSAYINIRDIINNLDTNSLNYFNSLYDTEKLYPFYYKPSDKLKSLNTNKTILDNKNLLYSKIQIRNRISPYGLIFSQSSLNPPVNQTKKVVNVLKESLNQDEQTLSSLTSDKIYLLSTNTNTGANITSIDFDSLDKYELTQEDYLSKIEPKTFSTVRGENLYNILIAFKNLLDSHIHNINEPLAKSDPNWIILNDLILTLKDDLLNNSIRIN